MLYFMLSACTVFQRSPKTSQSQTCFAQRPQHLGLKHSTLTNPGLSFRHQQTQVQDYPLPAWQRPESSNSLSLLSSPPKPPPTSAPGSTAVYFARSQVTRFVAARER